MELSAVIARIQQMEVYFDEVSKVLYTCPERILEDFTIQKMIRELMEYMESGQWLQDFEVDSRGELPRNLKRGVLSEDGLYNVLSEITTMR